MPWKPYQFRGQSVFVRVLEGGKPIVHRSRVEIRYKLGATKSYRALPDDLVATDEPIISDAEMKGSPAGSSRTKAPPEEPSRPPDENTIIIHTDGACSGNPGPAGIGVLIERPDEVVEMSEYIGSGTNNIAELTAILRALEELRDDERKSAIHLYTDSGWSLGVLLQGWKAKSNLELIAQIQECAKQFPELEMIKIRGHAGHSGNEEADRLATMAVRREDSQVRRRKRRRRANETA